MSFLTVLAILSAPGDATDDPAGTTGTTGTAVVSPPDDATEDSKGPPGTAVAPPSRMELVLPWRDWVRLQGTSTLASSLVQTVRSRWKDCSACGSVIGPPSQHGGVVLWGRNYGDGRDFNKDGLGNKCATCDAYFCDDCFNEDFDVEAGCGNLVLCQGCGDLQCPTCARDHHVCDGCERITCSRCGFGDPGGAKRFDPKDPSASWMCHETPCVYAQRFGKMLLLCQGCACGDNDCDTKYLMLPTLATEGAIEGTICHWCYDANPSRFKVPEEFQNI